MAVELFSENCGVSSSISPRISFSHDLSQSDVMPIEQQPFESKPSSDKLNPNTDFVFCVTESFDLESFPADEFFSDGRILPAEVKRSKNSNNSPSLMKKGTHLSAPKHPPPLFPPPLCVNNHHYNGSSSSSSSSKSLKKETSSKEGKYFNDEVCCDIKQQSSKSFWSFKRSSSCGSGYRRSLCPLPLLSRSNSTGSTSPDLNKRNSLSSKEGPNNNSKKHSNSSSSSSSSTRCSSPSLGPNIYQKPPLNYNKNGSSSYGNSSVRVSPALNVHSANLFGLGSIFSNNRDKSKKK